MGKCKFRICRTPAYTFIPRGIYGFEFIAPDVKLIVVMKNYRMFELRTVTYGVCCRAQIGPYIPVVSPYNGGGCFRINGYGRKRSEEHTSELQSRQYLVC